MQTKFKKLFRLILISELLATLVTGFAYGQDPVDYVNPNIGTIGHLITATTPAPPDML